LRSAAGVALIFGGVSALLGSATPTFFAGTLALIAVTSGLSLLLGFLTPIGGVAAGLCCVAAGLTLIPMDALEASQITPLALLVAVMAVSLGLLGPGAFSIDSRLFGRREIVISRLPRPDNDR
jgi:uncharacterized membrane protein YphA (DoxX/SURF4 family)